MDLLLRDSLTLLCHVKIEGEMNSELVRKSTGFDAFLRGPSRRGVSSSELGWKGFTIEEHSTERGDFPETVSEQHILGLWCGGHATGEYRNERGVYVPYTKNPGGFTLMPVGMIPAMRPYTRTDFLLCAFDPAFVDGIQEELDQRPTESLRFQTGIRDRTLYQLVTLLGAEVGRGGPFGRLYADHLAQALVMRFLLAGKVGERSARPEAASLPQHLLRRVIELMHDLDADLDLHTLAAETGYSRAHFVRMFQAATGQTPHRYLLNLRLTRAQQLLENRGTSLVDIAAMCGFSSQSHMSTAFRQLLGMTPAQYRRSL